MTPQFIAFHVALASVLVAGLLVPVGPNTMRFLILSVSAALMLAVPGIGAFTAFTTPVPDHYWQWVWLLAVIGMPAGFVMALTVVPSVLIRPPTGNYSTEAIVSLVMMAVGLAITATIIR